MEKKVFFTNSKGQKLCGVLEGPASDKGILLISGYTSGKEEWDDWMVHYAVALNKAGFRTLRFDRAGIGESEGDFVGSTINSEVDDCIAAYQFLLTKCKDVGASGHSMGGALVTVLASKVKLKAVIASSPSSKPAEVFKRVYTKAQISELESKGRLKIPSSWQNFGIRYIGLKYLKAREEFSIKRYASLINAPTLVVQGTNDKYCTVETAKLLFDALKCEKELKIINGGSHNFKPKQEEFYKLAAEWFKRYLK